MPTRPLAARAYRKPIFLALLAGLLLVASLLIKLDQAPALWWDEGWTLMLARNWLEQGFYGQIMDGQRLPPGLAASPVVAAPVALSFRLFGVGAWQGRLPFVLFTLANLALMFYIARRLYPRPVAWGMLFVMLFLPVDAAIHPIVVGRQTLGEMPSIFFLLLGMVCFTQALRKPLLWGVLTSISWGIALVTKAQVLPFWLTSAGLVLVISTLKRWRRPIVVITLTVVGTLFVWRLVIPWIQDLFLAGSTLLAQPLQGIYKTIAFVTDLQVRYSALQTVLSVGLLPLLGILYAVWEALKSLRKEAGNPEQTLLRWAMLGLSGSWMAWYLVLAMHWPRYLFPASFLGSLFASAMLYDLTQGFAIRRTLHEAGQVFSMLLKGKPDRRKFSSHLRSLLIVTWLVCCTVLTLLNLGLLAMNPISPQIVATYLTEVTQPHDLIETYESELMFLLEDRRFHFPPDQISIELTKRMATERSTMITYDPLAADPDYLVVGPYNIEWQLYDLVELSGEFTLVKEFPGYKIYARVRR